jgi:hypothetical protein
MGLLVIRPIEHAADMPRNSIEFAVLVDRSVGTTSAARGERREAAQVPDELGLRALARADRSKRT